MHHDLVRATLRNEWIAVGLMTGLNVSPQSTLVCDLHHYLQDELCTAQRIHPNFS